MASTTQNAAIASTYAHALLELAQAQGIAEQIGQELFGVRDSLASDSAFSAFFADPGISKDERGRILDRAIRPQVSPLLANFFGVANQHGRANLISEIADAYKKLLDELLGNIDVDVTVAVQLSDEQLDQVREKVSLALIKNAIVHQHVDPSIIGGLMLKIEDKLIDASVRSQLQSLKRQMLEKRPR